MIRRALGVLVTAVVLVDLTAAAAAAYTPRPGPWFNWPMGSVGEQDRIVTHVNRTIQSTPRGTTIRLAVFTLDRADIADNLIAAYRRGVRVQVVLADSDRVDSSANQHLMDVLGSDRKRGSFVYVCHFSCRGVHGNEHSKFFLFPRAGAARNVVMLGSVNLTGASAGVQWNDLLTVSSESLLRFYTRVFRQMVRDVPVHRPYMQDRAGDLEANVYPHYANARSNDPVMQRLREIHCRGARGGTGHRGRTVIRVSMYGWNEVRGVRLARKIGALHHAGCDVKALVSSAGGDVVDALTAADVPFKDADLDTDDDGNKDYYDHQKYMLVSGRYGRGSSWDVWTGSENWAGSSFFNDETTILISHRRTYLQYLRNFDLIWKHLG